MFHISNSSLIIEAPNVSAFSGPGGIQVNWNYVNEGRSYEVYRSVNGGRFTKIKTTKSSTFTDTKATKAGATYTYKVRAVSKMNGQTFRSDFGNEYSIVKLAAAKITSKKLLADGTVTFKFADVKQADGYEIIRSEYDYSGNYIDNVAIANIPADQKTYTITDDTATNTDVLYEYRVMAYRLGRETTETGETVITGETVALSQNYVDYIHYSDAMDASAVSVSSGIQVFADNNVFTTHFNVYRSVNGGKYKKVKTVPASYGSYGAELNWTDKNVKAGKVYTYKVEPTCSFALCKTSQVVTDSVIRIAGPKITSVTNLSENRIRVNWTAPKSSTPVAFYTVYCHPEYDSVMIPVAQVSAQTTSRLKICRGALQRLPPKGIYTYSRNQVLKEICHLRQKSVMLSAW